ncbi:uncharacterized protein VK521_016094 isoform 2-T2 [Ammospiza maritima maritima]
MSRRIRHPSPLWATCFSILLEQVLKNVLRPLSEALGQLLGAEGSQISKKDIVIIGADLLVETRLPVPLKKNVQRIFSNKAEFI